jgi:mannosyltransferase
VLAAGLRIYRLNDSGLWVDEIFTAIFASPDKTLVEVADASLSTPLPVPPLWFFISHVFMELLGTGDAVLRLPALIAGTLGVIAIYKVGQVFFDTRVGLVGALLLAVSPTHLFVSREARFYAAITLFSLLTIYCLSQGLRTDRRGWWIGFVLATLCNLYTHLTATFVLAAETVYVALLLFHHWRANRDLASSHRSPARGLVPRPYRVFLLTLLVIGLAYLPMVPHILAGARGERGLGNPGATEGLELSVDYSLMLFGDFGAGAGLSLSLFVAAALLGMWSARRTRGRPPLLFLLLACLPFGLVLILRPKHWFAEKYVIFLLPMYLLLVAQGIQYLAGRVCQLLPKWPAARHLAVAVLAVVYGLLSVSALDEAYEQRPDRWLSVSQLLTHNLQPGDAVVVLPTEILTLSITEIMAHYGPTTDDATIIPVQTAGQLQSVMDQYRRVWVVVDHRTDPEALGMVVTWLCDWPHLDLELARNTKVVYLGRDASAQALLEEAGQFTLFEAATYASLGDGFRAFQMWDRSIAAYEHALELEPDNATWAYDLATLYDASQRWASAELAYRHAVSLKPRSSTFHAALADYYSRMDRPAEALTHYQRAVRIARAGLADEPTAMVKAWRVALLALKSNLH